MMTARQAQVTRWDDLGNDEIEQDEASGQLLTKYHAMFDDDEPVIQPIRRTKPRREESNWG